MENQNLVSYVKDQMSKGIPADIIKDNLKGVGWSEEIINSTISSVMSIPVPPQSVVLAPKANVAEKPKVLVESLNSPYSVLLSIVLFVSLFILMNGVFSDIKTNSTTINMTLLFEGLFIIPSLLIAFIIHNSLKMDSKRYKILSSPYFAISAWILLRLLWKVAENLLSNDSALGVYVVLGMVILVLTGIIIFVQKYIKN